MSTPAAHSPAGDEAAPAPACPHCGKPVSTPKLRPLTETVGDTLEDLFEWDGKVTRTLRALLAHPGRLTTAYVEGRRTEYSRPFKMYLLFSAIYVFIFSIFVPETMFEEASRGLMLGAGNSQLGRQLDVDRIAESMASAFNSLIPILMFLSVPATALVQWILYRRTHHFYEEHLVFTIHVVCFSFLFYTATLWVLVNHPLIGLPGSLLFTYAYIYLALRNHFRQGRGVTFLKLMVLFLWGLVLGMIIQFVALIGSIFVALVPYMMNM
jgi:hypothetical protein